jgi:hypothetical protein
MTVEVSITDIPEDRDSVIFSLESARKAVCEAFDVTKDELMSKSRAGYITVPRFAFMYLSYYLTDNSTTVVGQYLSRDHTTIIHGLRRAIELKRSNKDGFAEKLELAIELARENEQRRKQQIKEIREFVEQTLDGDDNTINIQATARREPEKELSKKGRIVGDKIIFDTVCSE